MGEVLAFIGEIIVRIVFEAIFEGIFYGLKRVWYWLTGQSGKKLSNLELHQQRVEQRRKTLEKLRNERLRRRNQKR